VLTVRELPNPNGKIERTLFIPAFLEDNPIGASKDPDYEARLMARDEVTARALRFGDWSVFAGQMFPEFAKTLHTCRPFEIPKSWTRWVGIDWGYAAPWCVLWYARKPETGRVYVYRELYQVGIDDPRQAQLIREYSPGETFAYALADPSMWARKYTNQTPKPDEKQVIAKSIADIYSENGVLLSKANNDHTAKISKVRSALANIYDDAPAVVIFDNCEALIRTIPSLVRDPKNPDDITTGQEEHAFDAFSYGLTNWTPPVLNLNEKQKQKPQPNPWLKLKGI